MFFEKKAEGRGQKAEVREKGEKFSGFGGRNFLL
jgi:hypothetical protein